MSIVKGLLIHTAFIVMLYIIAWEMHWNELLFIVSSYIVIVALILLSMQYIREEGETLFDES